MNPQNFKKYFTTTSSERRGSVVLLGLLFLLAFFYWVDDLIYDAKPTEVLIEDLAEVKKVKLAETNYQNKLSKKEADLFQFNPNVIGKEEWERLGFSDKQAKSILNFRKSGFKFRKKEDLKKLFVVDEMKYKQLAPYIVIPTNTNKRKAKDCYRVFIGGADKPIYKGFENLGQVFYRKSNQEYQYYSNSYATWELAENQLKVVEKSAFANAYIKKTDCNLKLYPIRIKVDTLSVVPKKRKIKQVVNLNRADTTELKSLAGIGSYYANKIIIYRAKLGGFYYKEQLLEVYGVKQEILDQNLELILIDTTLIQKININTASKDDLKLHPYIKWNVANSIVLYRANHGKYKKIEDVQKSILINDELYEKIKGYLTVK